MHIHIKIYFFLYYKSQAFNIFFLKTIFIINNDTKNKSKKFSIL